MLLGFNRKFLCVALVSSLSLVLTPSFVAQTAPLSLSPDRWVISQKNFKLTQDEDISHNGEISDFLGKPSLRVSKGLFYSRDVEFQDGAIDVDVASASGRFFGIAFHVRSDDEYELIFFRPRTVLADQQMQYTPVLLGAPAWQLYSGPGYTSGTKIPRNEWFHVRLVVSGKEAKVFLNNAPEPALVVPDLKLGNAKGSIGFWGHMGDSYFANLSYTPQPASPWPTPKPHFAPGALTGWSLSQTFDASSLKLAISPDKRHLKWEKIEAEDAGMVLINRYRRSPNVLPPERPDRVKGDKTGGQVVYARSVIHSDRDQVRKMSIGYSDEVTVYLNGKPLYSGNNTLSFRQPEFLGVLDGESDAVFLPLKKGDNELVLAVTEYFGGWAFACRWSQE